jgi:valyl-tRNA synthetase
MPALANVMRLLLEIDTPLANTDVSKLTAFAEVAYDERSTRLNYFDFDGLEIATTRPELLAACVAVAVHPGDERDGPAVRPALAVRPIRWT